VPPIRHQESWVELDQLGASRPYRPTFSEAHTLGATFHRLLEAPLKPDSVVIDIGIPGSLRREDAAKLYEMAYFAEGYLLELGCARGLSTAIIAQGLHDSGRTARVVSVDLEPRMIQRTQANLGSLNLRERVELLQGDAAMIGRSLVAQGRTFGFVFVDHSHAYADVLTVCRLLPSLVKDGGFVLFHDFNDRRNKDRVNPSYGVYSAVIDGLPTPPFAFFGVFGCAGLYRQDRAAAGEGEVRDRSSPILGV
jgi:predicted O-methyltransferase YrrM